jgi:hypothetical protein
MSLLRRRSSQTVLAQLDKDRLRSTGTRDLPDDFDPGIIYGTRHPDWSSHPKRGLEEQRRSLSPVPVGPRSPGLPVKGAGTGLNLDVESAQGIDTRINTSMSPEETRRPISSIDKPLSSSPPLASPPPQPVAGTETLSPPITPGTIASPVRPPSALSSDADGADTPSSERRRGVTLVDHPLALPHHAIMNSSRFSFEESSKSPSAAQSQNGRDEVYAPVAVDDDNDRSSFVDDFQFDLDNEYDDDDGFERANEGLFETGFVDNDADKYSELTAAVKAMDFSIRQEEQGIGMAVSNGASIQPNVELAATETITKSSFPVENGDLSIMDPQSVAAEEPTKQPSPSHRRPMASPRGLDLSDDSDLDYIDGDQGLAGYEDDDDDLYYDDGFIAEMYGGPPEDGEQQQPQPQLQPQQQPQNLTIQSPATGDTLGDNIFGPDGSATAIHRLSMATTGLSSGLIPQDGSMATQPDGPTPEFPPFINPVGGGLGFTPQQHQFYAPNVSGTMLNGYALSSLTATLQQYQQQQIGLAGAPQSPSEGYDSDINERPNFGSSSDMDFDFDYDGELDDDDAMVAAANAEALANDSEGFYGSEFGFYPSNATGGLSYAGGFFGAAGANGDVLRPPIRRPSLTPISERSESSYRNSLVFPMAGSLSGGGGGGWGTVGPLTPGSWGTDGGEELSLGQLLQLRRNAWGGSNGSMRSSGSAGGGSPVGSPLGWPEMGAKLTTADLAPPATAMETQQQQTMIAPSYAPPPPPPPGMGEQLIPPEQQTQQNDGKMSPPLHAVPPPGLQHAGNKAMLPTKGSFEDPLTHTERIQY